MNRRIYLDVDDTLADFRAAAIAGGVPPWTGTWYTEPRETWDSEQLKIDKMTMDLMHQPEFWRTMPMTEGAEHLIRIASFHGEVHLLTALPRDMGPEAKGMVRLEKMEYCKKAFGLHPSRIIICERKDKVLYARRSRSYVDPMPILVDDALQNCAEWASAGGYAIHHKHNMRETIQALVEACEVETD